MEKEVPNCANCAHNFWKLNQANIILSHLQQSEGLLRADRDRLQKELQGERKNNVLLTAYIRDQAAASIAAMKRRAVLAPPPSGATS